MLDRLINDLMRRIGKNSLSPGEGGNKFQAASKKSEALSVGVLQPFEGGGFGAKKGPQANEIVMSSKHSMVIYKKD